MELLFGLAALVLLAFLALRFGADSRPGLQSAEHMLADQGYVPDRVQDLALETTEVPLASTLRVAAGRSASAATEPAPAIDRRLAA